ncbi:hypothetical protein FQZ97_1070940 [compost metagenome]
MHHIELAVVEHLVDGRGIAHVLLLQSHGVGIQGLVALHFMPFGIAALQIVAQAVVGDELAHLILQRLRIGLEIAKWSHAGIITTK